MDATVLRMRRAHPCPDSEKPGRPEAKMDLRHLDTLSSVCFDG